jgi:hypothetical protein
MGQERMGPPRLRESTNQHLLAGFEEYQFYFVTESLNPLKNPHEIGKKHTFSDIDSEYNILNLAPLLMTQIDESRQKGRG